MGKIIAVLAVCAAGGYLYKYGYFSQWVGSAQDNVASNLQAQAEVTRAVHEKQMAERIKNYDKIIAAADKPGARVPSATDEACERARRNLQQAQSYTQSSGSLTGGSGNPLAFDPSRMGGGGNSEALERDRAFVAKNCR